MSRDETKDDVVRLRRSKRKRRPPRVFSTIPATRRTRFDRRWTIQTLPFDDTDARPTDVPVLFKDASKKIDIAKVIGPCPWNVIDRAYATDRHEWMSKLAKARVTSVRPIEGWATYEAHVRTGKAQTQDEFELPKRREEWPERTAYASLYYDTSDIKDVALSVLPSSLALDKGLTHQIFLSFETTRSLVHFDNTDSVRSCSSSTLSSLPSQSDSPRNSCAASLHLLRQEDRLARASERARPSG